MAAQPQAFGATADSDIDLMNSGREVRPPGACNNRFVQLKSRIVRGSPYTLGAELQHSAECPVAKRSAAPRGWTYAATCKRGGPLGLLQGEGLGPVGFGRLGGHRGIPSHIPQTTSTPTSPP